jgi:hypothetical protein
MLRSRQEHRVREVQKRARQAQRREFTCLADALASCFNMYRRRIELDQNKKGKGWPNASGEITGLYASFGSGDYL